MNVKVFQTNEKGKIEFTRCELEKLLNETYKDGYSDGENHTKGDYWTWTTPSLTISNLTAPVCEQPKNSTTKAALTPAKSPAQTYDINVAKDLDLNLDLNGLAKTIDEILSGNVDSFFKHSSPSTPMNNLAKELCEL